MVFFVLFIFGWMKESGTHSWRNCLEERSQERNISQSTLQYSSRNFDSSEVPSTTGVNSPHTHPPHGSLQGYQGGGGTSEERRSPTSPNKQKHRRTLSSSAAPIDVLIEVLKHLQKLAIAKNIQWTKKTWDHTGIEFETKKNDELDNKKYKWTHPFVLCSCQATNSTQNASGLTAFWTPSIWGLCGVWNYECLLWQYSLQLLIYAVLSLLGYHKSAIEPSLRRSSFSFSLISHFWPSLPPRVSGFLSQNFQSASVKRNSSRAFGMNLH
jgi:hypothetical protein